MVLPLVVAAASVATGSERVERALVVLVVARREPACEPPEGGPSAPLRIVPRLLPALSTKGTAPLQAGEGDTSTTPGDTTCSGICTVTTVTVTGEREAWPSVLLRGRESRGVAVAPAANGRTCAASVAVSIRSELRVCR